MIFKKKTLPTKRIPAVYMWNMKPDEKQSIPMKNIVANESVFEPTIIEAKEVESLIHEMNDQQMLSLWNKIPWWIVKADLGRLLYVYLNGGFYFDVDCKVKKSFNIEAENNVVLFVEKKLNSLDKLGPREQKTEERKLRIANYAFGSYKKKHPFFKRVIDECFNRLELIFKENQEQITDLDVVWLCGPDVITSVYHDFNDLHNDIILLEKKYLKHESYGGWRS